MTYKLRVIADGIETIIDMPDSFGEQLKAFSAWEGWCRCGNPKPGATHERGHSVDVDCANCGGVLQIG